MRLNASRCLLYPEENEAGTARVYGLSAELPSEDRKNEAAPIGIPGERLFVACRRIFESFGLTAAIGGWFTIRASGFYVRNRSDPLLGVWRKEETKAAAEKGIISVDDLDWPLFRELGKY
jgi:hypothetical protein